MKVKKPKMRNWLAIHAHFRTGSGNHGDKKKQRIIINDNPDPELKDVVIVYWFKEGKDQQVWKQVLRYVK